MPNHINKFKQDITKDDITPLVLEIISNSTCPYFNARKIRYEIYSKYDIELRGRPTSTTNVCNDLHFKIFLASRIGHVTRKLKKQGYIEKFNHNTWKKIKEINLNDSKLYLNDT